MMTTADLVGYSAATLTTVSYLPQAYKAIRSKDTRSLSFGMYTILTIGLSLWLAYGILKSDLAIILANATTACLSLLILITKIKYELFPRK